MPACSGRLKVPRNAATAASRVTASLRVGSRRTPATDPHSRSTAQNMPASPCPAAASAQLVLVTVARNGPFCAVGSRPVTCVLVTADRGPAVPVVVDPAVLGGYAAFPPELDRDWLGRVCQLGAADLEQVRRRTEERTRLGYSSSACTATRSIGETEALCRHASIRTLSPLQPTLPRRPGPLAGPTRPRRAPRTARSNTRPITGQRPPVQDSVPILLTGQAARQQCLGSTRASRRRSQGGVRLTMRPST